MKRCPKCNRTYKDDTLRFCLEDGASLTDPVSSDATRVSPRSEPPATEILYDRSSPTLKVSGPTNASFPRVSESPPVRQSNSVLTVGVVTIAILLLALVVIAGYFVMRTTSTNQSAGTNNQKPVNKDAGQTIAAKPTDSSDAIATESPQNSPLKITASASSQRLAVQSNTYFAANAIDNKRATAWIEGADGPGVGEWIKFDFDREITLHRILVLPGYFKSPQIWAENNRIASMTAQFSDGSSRTLTFSDRMDSQKIDVGTVKTRWVRFVIKDVYLGTDPDTALSEVAFEWEP